MLHHNIDFATRRIVLIRLPSVPKQPISGVVLRYRFFYSIENSRQEKEVIESD